MDILTKFLTAAPRLSSCVVATAIPLTACASSDDGSQRCHLLTSRLALSSSCSSASHLRLDCPHGFTGGNLPFAYAVQMLVTGSLQAQSSCTQEEPLQSQVSVTRVRRAGKTDMRDSTRSEQQCPGSSAWGWNCSSSAHRLKTETD